jgi:hypothetical protein
MATTTPNYGWTVPTSTDLVKDGATAIETLGDAIDASMNTALGTKKAGMVLLNTTSFSGVASASLPTNTFTSTYTNYKIYLNITSSTASTYLYARLRAAGSDITTGNYNSATIQAAYGSTALANDNSGTSQTSWTRFGWLDGSAQSDFTIDLMSPQATAYTSFVNQNGRSGYGYQTAGGNFNATTSADSITFYPLSGNFTGVYSVYGVNK